MSRTWLVCDSNYLCHRAYHAMGHLTHEDIMVGVVYGFLRDIPLFQEQFNTTRMVWCFDHGLGERLAIDPNYKSARKAKRDALEPEEKAAKAEFYKQVGRLRDKYLPALGFRNVLHQPGYEADDMVASVCHNLPEGDEAIIISADQDLWQLLATNVIQYNPKQRTFMTDAGFRQKWGIDPVQWADVKAMAGCGTDSVAGIEDIGEVTAAKWVRGKLPRHYKAFAKIEAGLAIAAHNMKLVRLPLPGTDIHTLRDDRCTDERWAKVADKLGMKSIRDRTPAGVKGSTRGKKEGFGL